jgi:hypothetical protein
MRLKYEPVVRHCTGPWAVKKQRWVTEGVGANIGQYHCKIIANNEVRKANRIFNGPFVVQKVKFTGPAC